MLNAFRMLAVTAALFPATLWAWGEYGHEQISHAAITMSHDFPLGVCLNKNIDSLTRLAIAPDAEWKMSPIERGKLKVLNSKKDLTPADKEELAYLEAKRKADAVEHDNHFFQIDSFAEAGADGTIDPKLIAKLPAELKYDKNFSGLKALLKPNVARLNNLPTTKSTEKIDADNITVENLIRQGTAPFRIADMHDRILKALKKGDTEAVVFLIGTEAHYKEDMYQPFHTSSIFNTPAGIHSSYEEEILEHAGKPPKAHGADGKKIWDFSNTEAKVIDFANASLRKDKTPVGIDGVIPLIYAAAASGRSYVNELQRAFTEVHPAPPPPKGEIRLNSGELTRFSAKMIKIPGQPEQNVLDSALDRMGQSAALLNREWRGLSDEYQKMRENDATLPDLAECAKLTFTPQYTVAHYVTLDTGVVGKAHAPMNPERAPQNPNH